MSVVVVNRARRAVPPALGSYNDFSQYETASRPSDWTGAQTASNDWLVQADANSLGGKSLRQQGTANQVYAFLQNTVADQADMHLLAVCEAASNTIANFLGLVARASATAGYAFGFGSGVTQLELRRYTGLNAYTLLASAPVTKGLRNLPYVFELSAQGTTLNGRVFPLGAARPAWQITATDPNIASGGAGFINAVSSGVPHRYHYFDYALGGAAPPLPDLGSISGVGQSFDTYRLLVFANNGYASNFVVTEFELRSAAGGSNLAALGTATASESANANFNAPKAVDGSTTTGWASPNTSYAHWLQVRTAAPFVLTHFTVGGSPFAPYDTAPVKDFILYGVAADGSLKHLKTVTGQTGWAAGEKRAFSV